jgi:hypothetical protein
MSPLRSPESFQLLFLESLSLEESYRTLFDRVGALGADAFVAAMQKHKQDLVSGALKRPAEELVGRVVKSLVERHSEKVEGEGGSLTSVLGGDASLRDLLDQYLQHIPDQQRRQLVQVSSTLQLIVQVRIGFGYRFHLGTVQGDESGRK